jgi:hypothetical protein
MVNRFEKQRSGRNQCLTNGIIWRPLYLVRLRRKIDSQFLSHNTNFQI